MNLNKYLEYAKFMGCDSDVLDWINTHLKSYLANNKENQTKIEHILDYFASNARPKRISRMSYEQAKSNTKKWNKSLIKRGKNITETDSDIEVVLNFNDGFKFVKLKSQRAYEREGNLMRHCVASYYGRDVNVYSLRDEDNKPHCTIEEDRQIKGKGNGCISPKYIKYVVEFLENLGMSVSDSEMSNLGYINIETLLPKLSKTHNNIFRNKYIYKEATLYDHQGKELCDLELLKIKSLINPDNNLNYDLSTFLPTAISNFIKEVSNG